MYTDWRILKVALHTLFKVGNKIFLVGAELEFRLTPAPGSFVKKILASEVKQVLEPCSCRDSSGERLKKKQRGC